ncbi:MAG: ABC transporter permease [Dehalococcoidia bacterium]|nr:ABC transporter permease [Dehalococcoidia bacterium]
MQQTYAPPVTPGAPRRALTWLIRFVRAKPLGAAGGFLVLLMVLMALLAPVLATHTPDRNSADILVGPDGEHIFGTDRFGRDVFSRILYGARISLWVGIVSLTIGTVAGTFLALISGYFGGKTDFIIQRVMDSLLAFPALVLALAIVSTLGQSTTNVMAAIGVIFIPGTTRVVRSAVLVAREEAYIDAARILGCSNSRIMFRHILPNVTAPIIVLVTVGLGNAIIIEASLSFLGLGTPPPASSWGRDLSDWRAWWTTSPHLFWPPAVAISLAVFGFNLLGDALRDVLDPRLRNR